MFNMLRVVSQRSAPANFPIVTLEPGGARPLVKGHTVDLTSRKERLFWVERRFRHTRDQSFLLQIVGESTHNLQSASSDEVQYPPGWVAGSNVQLEHNTRTLKGPPNN